MTKPVPTDPAELVAELKATRREVREIRGHLWDATRAIMDFLEALDEEMKLPSSFERGQRIGLLSDRLKLACDMARRFGLGLDWDGKKLKRPCR